MIGGISLRSTGNVALFTKACEFFEKLSLSRRRALWDLNHDSSDVITARNALTMNAKLLTRRSPRWDRHVDPPTQGVQRHLAAENRMRDRYREIRVDIVPFPPVFRIGRNANPHKEISTWRSAEPGTAEPGEA